MSLALIKIDPEQAVAHLTLVIEQGYALKDKLLAGFTSGELADDDGNKAYDEWLNDAMGALQDIFNSSVAALQLRDAGQATFRYTRGGENKLVTNTRIIMDAKLQILGHYLEEILRFYGHQINFIVADTFIVQKGSKNKAHVKKY